MNKGIGVKLFLSLIGFVLAGTPVWLYLLAKSVLAPEGFWQNLILLGLGVWVLGFIQIWLLIFLVIGLVLLWSDN